MDVNVKTTTVIQIDLTLEEAIECKRSLDKLKARTTILGRLYDILEDAELE